MLSLGRQRGQDEDAAAPVSVNEADINGIQLSLSNSGGNYFKLISRHPFRGPSGYHRGSVASIGQETTMFTWTSNGNFGENLLRSILGPR